MIDIAFSMGGRVPGCARRCPSARGMREPNDPNCQQRAHDLRGDECGRRCGLDAGEGVREHPGEGDGRVRETGGRGEPVGPTDVAADGEGNESALSGSHDPGDHDEQSDRGDDLGEHEGDRRSVLGRQMDGIELEHHVCAHGAHKTPGDLRGDVLRQGRGGEVAVQPLEQADRRVEVRTRR